jgi:hypothetical protein
VFYIPNYFAYQFPAVLLKSQNAAAAADDDDKKVQCMKPPTL